MSNIGTFTIEGQSFELARRELGGRRARNYYVVEARLAGSAMAPSVHTDEEHALLWCEATAMGMRSPMRAALLRAAAAAS